MSESIYDIINSLVNLGNKLTKEEFKRIRSMGSEEELIDAVSKMEAAGGYENLEDD